MKTQEAGLSERVIALEQQLKKTQRHYRVQMGLAFVVVIGAILISPVNHQVLAQGGGDPLTKLTKRVTMLEGKTQYITSGTDANGYPVSTFTACNVQIISGQRSTNGYPDDPWDPYDESHGGLARVNGLGNLIIGYNAKGHYDLDYNGGHPTSKDVRTGSHNLILGDFNNYSSFGGIIVGDNNTIAGAYASVTGGSENWAGGNRNESVSGGGFNTASGASCSVSGGYGNRAFGPRSSVVGGFRNRAFGNLSCVTAGTSNSALAPFSSVTGGVGNQATGRNSSVSGGSQNIAGGDLNGNAGTSVTGGYGNLATGIYSSVSGGIRNIANGGYGPAMNDIYQQGQGIWDGIGPTWVAAWFNGY